MKLNNKGFAITAVIYSILILFLMLFLSMIKVMNTERTRLEKVADTLHSGSVNMKEIIVTEGDVTTIKSFTTNYRGKYELTINNNSCFAYLPVYTVISLDGTNLKFTDNNGIDRTTDVNLFGTNCSKQNINSVQVTNVYTTNS